MKKFITLAGSVALFAATLLPALAVNSCTNGTTGPMSNNTCSVTNSSNVTVNNVNDAQIKNDVKTYVNTGRNSASNNTLGGNITTGNATSNVTVQSLANVNTTNVTSGFGSGNNTAGNIITGPFSNDDAFVTNAHKSAVNNDNTATVNNVVNSLAGTGLNNADNNTGPASVRTGNAALMVNVDNHINDNWTMVASGVGSGNNFAENGTTGPSSNNTATVTNAAEALVNNINDLLVNNVLRTLAGTGRNSASNNTLGGDIVTGNANSGVGVSTEGNFNVTTIAMALGGIGSSSASEDVTGPFSNNSTFVTNSQVYDVENWNNKCRSFDANDRFGKCDPNLLGVFNTNNDIVNTGGNNGDNNTGGGSIADGFANLWKSIFVHLNDTQTVIH